MTEGVREAAIKAGIIEQQVFEQGIRDLYRTAEMDGVFCLLTFFKAHCCCLKEVGRTFQHLAQRLIAALDACRHR